MLSLSLFFIGSLLSFLLLYFFSLSAPSRPSCFVETMKDRTQAWNREPPNSNPLSSHISHKFPTHLSSLFSLFDWNPPSFRFLSSIFSSQNRSFKGRDLGFRMGKTKAPWMHEIFLLFIYYFYYFYHLWNWWLICVWFGLIFLGFWLDFSKIGSGFFFFFSLVGWFWFMVFATNGRLWVVMLILGECNWKVAFVF